MYEKNNLRIYRNTVKNLAPVREKQANTTHYTLPIKMDGNWSNGFIIIHIILIIKGEMVKPSVGKWVSSRRRMNKEEQLLGFGLAASF
jgi:hypothetical protein